MEKNKIIAFLNKLKEIQVLPPHQVPSDAIDILNFCLKTHLIKIGGIGSNYMLDDKGHDFLDGIISWEDLVKEDKIEFIGIKVEGDYNDNSQNNNTESLFKFYSIIIL